MFNKNVSFLIVSIKSHTINIDEYGIHHIMSMDGTTPADPEGHPLVEQKVADYPTIEDLHLQVVREPLSQPQQSADASVPNNVEVEEPNEEPAEYVVDRIIRHVGSGKNRRCIVQ